MMCSLYASVQVIEISSFLPHGAVHGLRLHFYNSKGSVLDCFPMIIFRHTFIRFSCLHLGQNKGKFFNIVSFLILSRVLLPQTGHRIHSAVFVSIHYLLQISVHSCLFFVLGISRELVNSKGGGRLKVNILSFITLIHKIF